MIPDRLKKIIFRKLYNDLSHVEIIPFNNSIWFVDRDEKYWYFELQKDGTLWWRYQFFSEFFILFSLVRDEFQSILAEWVEEVLNSRVYITKVWRGIDSNGVEEVLNGEVVTAPWTQNIRSKEVVEVLDGKILSTVGNLPPSQVMVENVLKGEVISTYRQKRRQETQVEEILKSKGFSHDFVQEAIVQELFKNMIGTTTPDSNSDYSRVEDALNSI
jgi:hypothetical protein